MAIEIDLTQQLTEFELKYLVQRCRWDDIRQNAENLGIAEPNLPSVRDLRRQVPRKQLKNTDNFDKIAKQLGVKREKGDDEEDGGEEPVALQESPEAVVPVAVDYNKLTVPQLKEELDKRREQYQAQDDQEAAADVAYTTDDKKPDLISKLEYDDEAQVEAGDEPPL